MKKINITFLATILFSSLILTSCNKNNNVSSSNSSTTSSSSSSSNSTSSSNINEESLLNLQKSFRLEGQYEINGYTHPFTSIFTENGYYNSEFYYNNEYPEVLIPYEEYNVLFENDNVYLLQTNVDNTMKKTLYPDYTPDMFANPFKQLSVADFLKTENPNVFTVKLEKQLDLADSLTNWSHSEAKGMFVTFSNNQITNITATLSTAYDGDITYNMNFFEIGSASIPNVTYETKSEHEALKLAFENFNNKNYTVTVNDNAYSDESVKDITYKLYRDENTFYNDYDKLGFVRKDDQIFEFEVIDDKVVLGDLVTTNPFSMTPTLSVAPELFKLVSENTYTLQNNFLAKQALQSFALGNDLFRLATTYGLNLDVTIENNNLLGFSFNYNVESLYSKLSFTFSDVGTTTIPVDVNGSGSGEDPDPNPSLIPTEWIGTYTGTSSLGDFNGETNIIVVVGENTITVNNIEADVTGISEYDELILNINDTEYYLYNADYEGGVILALMSADYSFMAYNLVKDTQSGEDPDPAPSLIPTEWIGTYTGTSSSGDFNGETNITVVITESSITINGTSATVTSYDEYEGLTLDINGTEYYLTNMDYDGGVKLALMSADYSFMAYNLVKDTQSGEDPDPAPSLIPTEWIGTYTGTSSSGDFNGETNITVVITESSITINGTSATVTSYDEYEGLTLDINGTEYYLTNMDYEGGVKLALMSSDYSFIATGLVK